MKQHTALKQSIEHQISRFKKAERERPTLLSQSIYIGTLGLVMVIPIVGGAYLGHWLDSLVNGYSSRWTLSLIFAGVVMGGFNVYKLIKN